MCITTAAVVGEQGGGFGIEQVELDSPRADEVQVRIIAVGMCHTDLSAAGYHPVPGVHRLRDRFPERVRGGGERAEKRDRLRAGRARLGVVDDELLAWCGADVEGLHA